MSIRKVSDRIILWKYKSWLIKLIFFLQHLLDPLKPPTPVLQKFSERDRTLISNKNEMKRIPDQRLSEPKRNPNRKWQTWYQKIWEQGNGWSIQCFRAGYHLWRVFITSARTYLNRHWGKALKASVIKVCYNNPNFHWKGQTGIDAPWRCIVLRLLQWPDISPSLLNSRQPSHTGRINTTPR